MADELTDVDIEAIQVAVDTLDGDDFTVVRVDAIDRQATDDAKVRWTMTVKADARPTALSDFDLGDR